MKKLLFLVAALTAVPAVAADPVDDVRRAEIAFARAFADRDQAKFFSFVLDNASFLGGLRTLAGKKQIVERWSKFFGGATAPFSWAPERAVVAGNTGLSTGPVYGADGKQIGNYASVWRKQSDGAWKILFDGPGSQPACVAGDEERVEDGFVPTADGVRLRYRKVGSGPVTVIMPLDFIMFDDFKRLADLATVITYDMRDRGRSSRVEDVNKLTIRDDVADLEAVRAHFDAGHFVPIGYSYLGLMVAMYAMEHPDHVDRIVQLSPVAIRFDTQFPKELTHGDDDIEAPPEDLKRWQETQSQGMAAKSPREFCEIQDKVFRYLLVGNPAHASRVTSHCDLENEWPVNLDRHFTASINSIRKVSITSDQLKRLTMPVLTIHGTKDRNAPYGGGREWAMSLPNARLVTIEGAAHATWLDDPAAVFASIRQFLRGEWPLAASRFGR